MTKKQKITYSVSSLIILLTILGLYLYETHEDSAKKTNTKTHIQMLVAAVESYRYTYKGFPVITKGNNDYIVIDDYNDLLENLSCIDGPDKDKESLRNVRNQVFLKRHEGSDFTDDWKQRFKVILDSNFNATIKINNEPISATVLVYSFGPNKEDDKGQNDDICSWK